MASDTRPAGPGPGGAGAARDAAFQAVARSWVQHLRAGGTTAWADWVATPAARESGVLRPGGPLPGAAQLELLRLLNEEGPLPELADHVLARPGPGRGWVHLPLPWPPVRPTAPASEVRRVAVGVLADLTARLTPTKARAERRRRLFRNAERPSFVLEGLPVTVAALREELAAAGRFEHRPRLPWSSLRPRADDLPDRVVVVTGPVDEVLQEVWARRVLEGSGRSWRGFLRTWSSGDRLPPSADLERILDHWVPKVGADRVHVVVATRADPGALVDRVGELVGHRLPGLPEGRGVPRPVLLDLLRRVDEVLPFLLDEGPRVDARRALTGLLRQEPYGPRWVGLPRRRRDWAVGWGSRHIETVRASGATVHGDLEELASLSPAARGIRAVDTVAAAVRMIHRVGGTGGTGARTVHEGTSR